MAEVKDFLLEIGTEEMPSAPLAAAVKQLGHLVGARLDEAGLAHGQVRVISSPRRLAALVDDVATATEELHEVKRGPAERVAFTDDGMPTKAAEGFARKCGVTTRELVLREDADGHSYVFAERSVAAQGALPILSKLSRGVISSLEWPNYRSQRWGSTHDSFVRPVRWICALLGDEIVDVSYAGLTSSNTTRGHRVLAPGEHVVGTPAAYEGVLESAYVLSAERRRQTIRTGIEGLEASLGVHINAPKHVFEEVVNLCEWPTVLVGHFDEEFLTVPNEIICDSMLTNQRYFPVFDVNGQLTHTFVVVSNADPAVSETVIEGNERVVRARLDDAKFFYEEDLKSPLEAYLPRLEQVTFQEQLGTVRQKAARMEQLAPLVAVQALGLDEARAKLAARAALLAKADLVTQAVVEFTSQQGVMGGYYAAAAGEPAEVAEAIRDQYRPRFYGDEPPTSLVGIAVAISDKLDTICGMFAIDQPPTGSSDPFAVRRSAIGVITMLRHAPGRSLATLVTHALDAYAAQGLDLDVGKARASVLAFFSARVAVIARDEGISPDTIEAVLGAGVVDPAEFFERTAALERARLEHPELFDDLAVAYARAAHLAQPDLGFEVDESVLGQAEQALLDAIDATSTQVRTSLCAEDYEGALTALAALRAPVDRFFNDVLVMDNDLAVRDNRLRLLNRFTAVFDDVADIGALARS